jgi:dolichol kinase
MQWGRSETVSLLLLPVLEMQRYREGDKVYANLPGVLRYWASTDGPDDVRRRNRETLRVDVMLKEIPYVLLLSGAVILGLYLANSFYDAGIPQYVSRKIGHLAGCVAFLFLPFLFPSFWWPLILTIGFTGLLLYARLFKPRLFRGVGGSGRIDALAEIHFPATGIILVAVCWGIFDKPWLAVVPLAFMGGGDAITGLIRSRVYHKEVKGWWGSAGMLVSCLLLAYFIQPYWIGAVGAVIATIAERYTKTHQWYDDNLTIPLASALVMGLLYLI